MAKNKLTDEELIPILKNESEAAVFTSGSQLAFDMAEAMRFYTGEPFGNEKEGQSDFVTMEVFEAIEWMMPYLMRIFFSGDDVMRFKPEDEDDVESAEQETNYANWVFYEKNPGFMIGMQWIKDALIQKLGIVKCWWDKGESEIEEIYENLDPESLLALELDEEFEIKEVEELVDDEDQSLGLFNVIGMRTIDKGQVRIDNIAPEEFKINRGARTVQDARYASVETRMSISDLNAQGFDTDDLPEGDEGDNLFRNEVERARHEFDDTPSTLIDQSFREDSSREITVHDEYIRIDIDDDGVAELMHYIRAGSKILFEEEVEEIPYYAWTPIPISHKLYGMSWADIMMPIQEIKSQLTRNFLDNAKLAINGRYRVLDGQVNLDDLMSSAAHGIVREKVRGAVDTLPTPQVGPEHIAMIEYVDVLGEKRSGVSERTAGLDPSQFNSNTTADLGNRVMTAAESRIELCARVFAETGLKQLMLAIQRLGLKNEKPGKKISVNDKFIPVDPREWKERDDMKVVVGIGNGSKQEQINAMQTTGQLMNMAVSQGGLGTLITPTNAYNYLRDMAKLSGNPSPNSYFTQPESDEIDKGPSMEEQMKQAELQMKQEKQQADLQLAQMEEQRKVEELRLNQRKLDLQEAELQFKERVHEDDIEIKKAEFALEASQDRAVKLGND